MMTAGTEPYLHITIAMITLRLFSLSMTNCEIIFLRLKKTAAKKVDRFDNTVYYLVKAFKKSKKINLGIV